MKINVCFKKVIKYFLTAAILMFSHQLQALKIATYNTKLLNITAILYEAKLKHATFIPGKRAKAIANAFEDYDIVAFQEIMNPNDNRVIAKNMRKLGFEYSTGRPGDAWASTLCKRYLISGGVRIFSKHPIIETDTMIFTRCANAEKTTAKGVVFAKIQIDENKAPLNVFALHAQSSSAHMHNPEKEISFVESRESQFLALRDFIDSKEIPENEAILVVGDFNVQNGRADETNPTVKTETPEFLKTLMMLSAKNAGEYTENTLPYTLDVESNTFAQSVFRKHPVRAHLDHMICVKRTNGGVFHPCLGDYQKAPKMWIDEVKDKNGFDLSDHHRLSLETQDEPNQDTFFIQKDEYSAF